MTDSSAAREIEDLERNWCFLKGVVSNVLILKELESGTWTQAFEYPEDEPKLKVLGKLETCIKAKVKESGQLIEKSPTESLLQIYSNLWDNHYSYSKCLHSLFKSLTDSMSLQGGSNNGNDCFYLDDDVTKRDTYSLAMHLWNTEVLKPETSQRLVNLALSAIDEDRNAIFSNQKLSVVKNVIQSLDLIDQTYSVDESDDEFKVYTEKFEGPFFEKLEDYYQLESHRMLRDLSICQYMKKVVERLNKEEQWSAYILCKRSHEKVKDVFVEKFISNNVEQMIDAGIKMIEEESTDDLANFYQIFKSILHTKIGDSFQTEDEIKSSLQQFVDAFQVHVQKKALESINQLAGQDMHIEYFEKLLSVHKSFTAMIEEKFEGNLMFDSAIKNAFQYVGTQPVRGCNDSPAALFAKYCDMVLRKKSGEADLENDIQTIQTLLKYLYEQDSFVKYFIRLTAKRLLFQLSESIESEMMMITMLRRGCGMEGVELLQKMISDIQVSKDLMDEFNASKDINFNINTLQESAWPLPKSHVANIYLPREIVVATDEYMSFYINKFKQRKLKWHYPSSKCEVQLNYTEKKYRVSMDVCHFSILGLFETTDSLTYEDIQACVPLPDESLKVHLNAIAKFNFLICNTKMVERDSYFDLNLAYKNSKMRVKIVNNSSGERLTPEEKSQTDKSIESDRKFFVQAAIVRIMKANKKLSHTDLVTKVMEQTKNKFSLKAYLIKTCIDVLIERGFIARSPESMNIYNYVD